MSERFTRRELGTQEFPGRPRTAWHPTLCRRHLPGPPHPARRPCWAGALAHASILAAGRAERRERLDGSAARQEMVPAGRQPGRCVRTVLVAGAGSPALPGYLEWYDRSLHVPERARRGPRRRGGPAAVAFVATVNVVLLQHALPVFVDTDRASFQIDAGKIEAAITPRTRAMLPVHLGVPSDMDRIRAVAGKHKVPVIEDACQAHLSEWRQKKVGKRGSSAASVSRPPRI